MADGDELTREVGADLLARTQRLIARLDAKHADRSTAELARLRRELAQAERATLLDLHARRLVDDETFRQLERELDLEEQLS